MGGVLSGFATIGAVIALGAFLAHVRVLDLNAQTLLSRLAFFVASPALLLIVLSESDVTQVLSRNLVATAAAMLVVVALYVACARLVLRRDLADTVIGALSAAYVNAGNLGLPIAAYVLGDVALVAPTLLMQMLVLQPFALAVLDTAVAPERLSPWRLLMRPLQTPLTVASMIGVAISLSGWTLPEPIHAPLDLIGGMAVPGMLLAYGVSLRLGPKPGADAKPAELALITGLKLVVQPAVAWAVASFALGLEGNALLAVTVMSALPTAQNIFVHATRYDRAVVLARDSIFLTTVLSVPAIFLIVALLA